MSHKKSKHSQSFIGLEGGSYKEIRQYTYFDSTTKKYLDQRRKNQIKRQQNRIDKERRQLARCTFRPAIESKPYYQACRKIQKIKEGVTQTQEEKAKNQVKMKPEQRLHEWGVKKQRQRRNKIIERELQLINFTKSLSKERFSINKLNRSLQDFTRRSTHEQSFTRSIKAVPLATRDEFNNKTYKTLQGYRKNG